MGNIIQGRAGATYSAVFVRNLLQRKLNQAKSQCWGKSVAKDYVRNKGLAQRKEIFGTVEGCLSSLEVGT